MNTPAWRRFAAACLIASLQGCATPPDTQSVSPSAASATPKRELASASPEVRAALAPTGRLRIAVYPGSPTSLLRQPGSDKELGLSVDIGRELARRLGVPAELVVHDRVAQVVEALQAGRADVTITNASPARALLVDFAAPVVALELGYLVLPASPITALDQADRPGMRIGVSQGSSSQAALGQRMKLATLVPAASLKEAAAFLQHGRIDAFATNKGILNELADGLPGARILPGRWGTESLALAVPQGRQIGAAYLRAFVASVREQGLVEQAATRAGLRGLAEPER